MTVGVTVYYRAPESARIDVKTEQGDFAFRVGDVLYVKTAGTRPAPTGNRRF